LRRIIVIASVLMSLIVAGLIYLMLADKPREMEPIESQSVGYVVIDNASGLNKFLLSRQTSAVESAISGYILDRIDKNVEHAFIVDEPLQRNDGTILVTVKTENPEKTFRVIVDRTTYFDKLVVSVPADDYKTTIKVY
jgi:multidrug efflux pump subunit AcrB